MSTFSGVVATTEPGSEGLAKLTPIGVQARPGGGAPAARGKRLYIDVHSLRPEVLEAFAQRVAEVTAAPAFVLLGQTSVDVYLVAEVSASGLVRRVEHSRDAEPPWSIAGSPRPWEADLHFVLPVDELVEDLLEEGWSDAEVEAVRGAHAARDPSRLTRLPPASRRSFVRFTESLGVDLEHPDATWKPPGLWKRLFGRA